MANRTYSATRPTVERCTDTEEWNAFVERNGGPLFARWEWGAACEGYGHDSIYLGARAADGRLVGALPLVRMRSPVFGDTVVSMPFSEYGSVVVDSDAEESDGATRRLTERAAELADESGVDFVSLRGRDLGEVPSYERRERWVTFEIPLGGGPEAVWDALDGDRRNHVRQARNNDLDVRRGESLDDLRTYYRLYLESQRGHGSPPHSFEFFERLWDAFHPDDMRLQMVEHDGKLINASIEFPFGDAIYGWSGVSDYEYRGLDGGSLNQWRILEWGAENGYDTYSLGRTEEGSGVYTFKKSFGGEKVWLTDYHYFPTDGVELPNPRKEKYESVKDVWRRLPLPVTRVVGSRIRKDISL